MQQMAVSQALLLTQSLQYFLLHLQIYHSVLMTSGTSAKRNIHDMDHILDTSWITSVFEAFF